MKAICLTCMFSVLSFQFACGRVEAGHSNAKQMASKDEKILQKSLEWRWNTAMLRTYQSRDQFDFIGKHVSVLDYFKWTRCEDGNVSAGAHPTYRGGSAEAYAIAEKILATLNLEKAPEDTEVKLEDLAIDCH